MKTNNKTKTLKEIAQITFDTYGIPGEDDCLTTQATLVAMEEYGYKHLFYSDLAELASHCDELLADAEEDEIDEDSREGRHEMRLDYCNDDPERAAEIWGDFEDDYSDALDKIEALEAELKIANLSAAVYASDLVGSIYWGNSVELHTDIAILGGMDEDDYVDYRVEQFDYDAAFARQEYKDAKGNS